MSDKAATFAADELIAEAREQTGFEDFGEPPYREGLEVLLETYDRNVADPEGRKRCRDKVVMQLATRLRCENAFKTIPDIANQQIKAPIFVTGLPRSGTSALLNLLVNAHRYGRDGGMVRLALKRGRREILFTVADDGPGIAEADQPRIFERFYRPRTEAARRIQGSGLGLPIARAMVELHGGRIWLESRSGEGAILHIALPTGGVPEASP